jgi:outer membrane receptor protein involved in Fe transport
MDYDNFSAVDYKFDMSSMNPNIPVLNRTVEVPFKGRESLDFLELLPKFAVNYTTGVGDVYATVTRGYKAGGFNTQIFSDILQNKMKTALMADAMSAMGSGGAPGGGGMPGGAPSGQPSTSAPQQPAGGAAYDEASVTTYDPEYSWSYEVGTHLKFIEGRMLLDVSAFWIECRDQQLTVFPEGLTTGRMMSNAGKSRSRGAELSLEWRRRVPLRGLSLTANYGYTSAKFVEFSDGVNDYAGNHLPYAPAHTVSLGASYRFFVGGGFLYYIDLNASWQGAGSIYWNEANDASQPFYALLDASVRLHTEYGSVALWGRNLTNTRYNTFCFASMGNRFLQRGKPTTLGITLNITIDNK